MATRFYLPAAAATTPMSPTPDAAWEDQSILARAMTSTTPIGDTMATVTFPDDANAANKDILYRQYVSAALAASQTVTGGQAIKAQCRVMEVDVGNNLFFTIGIRVIASDGSTVQKTVLTVTRDNGEASASALTNRQYTATSAVTDYTTVAGDRLVIEIGMGGDPGVGSAHDSSMRLGDSAASDLPEDGTDTTDKRPWIELTDTLTFASTGGNPWYAYAQQ